jgi:glycosyltransferase involved in cell wall biosynthesis
MQQRIGILYVIDQLVGLGGAEQTLLRTIRHLPLDRFQPFVLTFRLNRDVEAFRDIGCPVDVFPVYGLFTLNSLRYAPRFLKSIRQRNIRIVHTFFETSDLWAGTLAKAGSGAVLVSSRRDLGIQRNFRLTVLYRLRGRMFDQVHGVSDQVRDYFMHLDHLDPARMYTVPNGIDLTRIPPDAAGTAARRKWGLPADVPLITTVANIRPVKGIETLLHTAAEVHTKHPEVRFAVAGATSDEPYYTKMKDLARQLGVENCVRFLGVVDDPLALLRGSQIFFLPSRSEGMSNALLEAMSCALPCVATAVGGNCQLVQDGRSGYLVPVEDARVASARIVSLLEDGDQARRMGAEARRVVEAQYSVEVVTEQLIRHYESLLQQRGLVG